MTSSRRSPRAGLLAAGFVVALLGSEALLTLPDETASATELIDFYTAHRGFVIALQGVGIIAAALLFAYARTLRRVDQLTSWAGVLVSLTATLPGLLTASVALLATRQHAALAVRLNGLGPRADDVLFVGISLFAVAVALRLAGPRRWLTVLGLAVATACLLRLLLEGTGHSRGAFESVGPIGFVVLVAVLGVLSYLGRLTPPTSPPPSSSTVVPTSAG